MMDWGMVIWGLLLGIAGLLWMLVLAIIQGPHERASGTFPNESQKGSASNGDDNGAKAA
jgi:hypothetical protein